MERKTVVIGVIGSDVHAVGNKVIDYALNKAGFNVVNIGVLSTQDDFINAAVETNADCIMVSSLYGHAELDCQGFREKCNEAGLNDILLYIGGNIVVGKQGFDEIIVRFKNLGFDRVYPPGINIETGIDDLKKDLKII